MKKKENSTDAIGSVYSYSDAQHALKLWWKKLTFARRSGEVNVMSERGKFHLFHSAAHLLIYTSCIANRTTPIIHLLVCSHPVGE